jgi:hypothetical protein
MLPGLLTMSQLAVVTPTISMTLYADEEPKVSAQPVPGLISVAVDVLTTFPVVDVLAIAMTFLTPGDGAGSV